VELIRSPPPGMTPPSGVAMMTQASPPATAPTPVTAERASTATGPLSLNTTDTWGEVDMLTSQSMSIDAHLDNDGRPPSRQKSPFPTGLDFERNGPRPAFHDPTNGHVHGSVASPVKISDIAGCASPAQKLHVTEVMETLNSSGGGRPVSRQGMRRQKMRPPPQEESLFYTVNTSDIMANEPGTPTRLDHGHSEPGSPTHHQASPSVDRVQSRKSPRPVADMNAPAFSEPSSQRSPRGVMSPRADIQVDVEPQSPSVDRVQSRKSPRNKSPRAGSGSAAYENGGMPVSPMVAPTAKPTASWATVQVGVGGPGDGHDAMSNPLSEQDCLESSLDDEFLGLFSV